MKKKFLSMLFIFCIMLFMGSFLYGCKSSQILMTQIDDALENGDFSSFEDVNISRIERTTGSVDTWTVYFERQNIDTTNFKCVDRYKVYVDGNFSESLYIYVFKFSNNKDVLMCKKYQFDGEYDVKIYGNLAVASDKLISSFVFSVIDNIKAK